MENPTNPQAPEVPQVPVKKTPMEMVQLGVKAIVLKVTSLIPKSSKSTVSVTPTPTTTSADKTDVDSQSVSQAKLWTHAVPPSLSTKPRLPIKKIAIFGGGFLVLIIILLILAKIFKVALPIENPLDFATPTPSPTVSPTLAPISRYATDSAVLKLEQDIITLDQELLNVDLDEESLKPRPLKFDINFQ